MANEPALPMATLTPPAALVVLTTVENTQQAEQLASKLVTAELAACVQILPAINSVYRWQGKLECASEILLLIKTTAAAYPALESAILQAHPYETPEIVALPVAAISATYEQWLTAGVKPLAAR